MCSNRRITAAMSSTSLFSIQCGRSSPSCHQATRLTTGILAHCSWGEWASRAVPVNTLSFRPIIAATFTETGEVDEPVAEVPEDMDPGLMFSTAPLNSDARKRFKKALSGIINVRSNGRELYAARRVAAGYQWEAYEPIDVS